MLSLERLKLGFSNAASNALLAAFIDEHNLSDGKPCEFLLTVNNQTHGIELHQLTSKKPLVYSIDIAGFIKQQKTYPAPKQGAFNQALGKHTKTVIDATGGWGGDTLLMCAQGLQVTLIERHPILALLLRDAMQRLASTDWARQHRVIVPEVYQGNAIDVLPNMPIADAVYLDPMFPPKRKKSAATNKYMALLHELIGQDDDVHQLWQVALASVNKRVVVKRPDYAEPIGQQPDVRFGSKLVHYDVYLK